MLEAIMNCRITDGTKFITQGEAATILGCSNKTLAKRLARYRQNGLKTVTIQELQRLTEKWRCSTGSDMPRQRTWTHNDIKPGVGGPYDAAYSTPVSLRFTKAQHAYLEAQRKKTGVMISELVRRAVDEYSERHK